MPYEPNVPEGHHLGMSRSADGEVTGHIFEDGTNALKGHASWKWVDESTSGTDYSYVAEERRQMTPEERELALKLAVLIIMGIIVGVDKAAPHVVRWWNSTVKPFLARIPNTLKKPFQRNGAHNSDDSPMVLEARIISQLPSTDIQVATSTVRMSRDEWMNRFRAMMAAGHFRDEQAKILSNAEIVDIAGSIDAPVGAEELSAAEFSLMVEKLLEQFPTLRDSEATREFQRLAIEQIEKSARDND